MTGFWNNMWMRLRSGDRSYYVCLAWIVLLLSFFLQVYSAVFLRDAGKLLPADGMLYLDYAHHLVDDGQFVQTVRPGEFLIPAPGLPLLLAVIYRLFGSHDVVVAALLNLLLLQFVGLLLFRFLMRRNIPPPVALLGQILIVWHPGLMLYSSMVLTESAFVLLSSAMLFGFWDYLIRGDKRDLLLFGSMWLLSILMRPHWLFLGLFLSPLLLLLKKQQWRVVSLWQVAVWSLAALIIGINYHIHGKVFPIVSYGGMALYIGNNPETRAWDVYKSSEPQYDTAFMKQVHAAPAKEQNRMFQHKATEYIKAHPFLFVYRTLVKNIVFWKPARHHYFVYEFLPATMERAVVALGQYLDLAISMLFWLTLAAMIVKRKMDRNMIVMLGFLLYYSALVSLNNNVPAARYRMPLMPFQLVFALHCLWRLTGNKSNKSV